MNRYNRYPGDYLRSTSDLSLAEHGAYTLLLDWYYSNERPIEDLRKFSVSRATSDDERKITQWVLDRFFKQEVRGDQLVWVHARAESEIAKARPKIEASRTNGNRGGRPRKADSDETQEEPTGLPDSKPSRFFTETRPGGGEGGGVIGGVGDSPAGVSAAAPPAPSAPLELHPGQPPSLPPASSPADPPAAQRSRARIAKPRPRRWTRVPDDWAGPNSGHQALASELRVNLAVELPKFRDHEYRTPKSDADAAFRTWIRNAAVFNPARPAGPHRLQTAVEVALARVAENEAAELVGNHEPTIFDDWEHVLG